MPTPQILTFKRFSAANLERHEDDYPENSEFSEADWALIIADAVGAVCRLVQQDPNTDEDLEGDIFDEIADAVTHLDNLCTEMGGSLDQVIARRYNAKSIELDSDLRLPVRS